MYDDQNARLISTTPRLPTAPSGWMFNRFIRGYLGGLSASALIALVLYVSGVMQSASHYSPALLAACLLFIPAIISFCAIQIMPVGSEASFLYARIVPKLGEGLRGVVAAAIWLCAWALMIFIMLGAFGMVWNGLRNLLR